MMLNDFVASIPNAVLADSGAVALTVIWLWPKRFDVHLPSMLVALLIGTAIGVSLLSDAPTIGMITTDLPTFELPDLSLGGGQAIEPALVIALVVAQLVDTAINQNTECIVLGLSGRPARNLQALDVLKRVPSDQFVNHWDEAKETAARLLAAQNG